MATGNRTLKLSILADVDDLKKKLGEGVDEFIKIYRMWYEYADGLF